MIKFAGLMECGGFATISFPLTHGPRKEVLLATTLNQCKLFTQAEINDIHKRRTPEFFSKVVKWVEAEEIREVKLLRSFDDSI